MVEAEAEPRTGDADEATEQEVEAKVAEVCEARAGDVNGGGDGDEDEDDGPDGWCRVLVAHGDDGFFGGVGVVLVEGEGLFPEIRGGDGRGVGWVLGVRAWREVGDCDGEFGGEEEGQVEEACPGKASMTTRKRFEAVFEFIGIVRGTNLRRDEHPIWIQRVSNNASNGKLLEALEIWFAARQQIWTGLAKEILHALGDHEGGCERKGETHPARVPLPQFAPPDERHGCSALSRRARDEQETDEEDDGGGRNEGDDGEEPCRYHFRLLVRVGDGEIDWRERAIEGIDEFPASTHCCYRDDDDPVEYIRSDEAHRRHTYAPETPHVGS